MPKTTTTATGIALQMTEWLRGYIGLGETDPQTGFIAGIDRSDRFESEAVITIDDVERFFADPTAYARMDGFVVCERLGGRRELRGGTLRVQRHPAEPSTRVLHACMPLRSDDGPPLVVIGRRTIADPSERALWSDASNLAVHVFDRELDAQALAAGGPLPPDPVAAGVLHLEMADGFRSARSFHAPGSTPGQAASAIKRFAGWYMGRLWQVFGTAHRVRL